LEQRCDSLATALGETDATIATLTTNVASITKTVDSIKTQLTGIVTQINTLNTELTQVNANITSIDAQITTLNSQYAALLVQLNNIIAQLTITPTTLTNGLVAYYPFSGNANDLSGNGNNGTVNGATLTTDRFGNANSAYSFNGVSNYILVNNSASINSPTISISGWFNTKTLPTDSNAGCKSLVSKWWQIPGTCGSNHDTYLVTLTYLGNDPTICAATQFYSGVTFFPNLSISTGTWYQFVFIHNATQGGQLYINGNLVVSNQTSGSICYSTNPLYIGVDNDGGTLWRYFNGSIDDIRIYNRALTTAEITYLATH